MPDIEAKDGTRLFAREWGGGRPVLFLHSWALSSEIWDDQMLTLAEAGYGAWITAMMLQTAGSNSRKVRPTA